MRKLALAFIAVSLLGLNGCDKIEKAINSSSQSSSSFSTTLSIAKTLSNGGTCHLDAINGVITKSATIAKVEPMTIGGWAVDDTTGTTPKPVIIRLTAGSQVFYAETSDRVSRPDVAKALNNPAFEQSGFNLTATLEAVPPGQYTLELLQPTASALLVCPDKGQIIVQ